MTIDGAIEKHRKMVETQKILYDACVLKECNKHFLREAEEHEQIAEWLEELKELKKSAPNRRFYTLGYNVGYNKAIDDFVHKVKEHQYVLSDVINSKDYGMFTIGIEQIAEQLKAGAGE